jgi:hypothetical protein
MAIKVGDVLKDNDPRSKGRLLYVRWAMVDGFVQVSTTPYGTRLTRIRTNRIHEDDKPRRTGYSLIRGSADGR